MSFEVPIVGGSASFPADVDLSAKQYYAVKLNGDGEIVLCATAGERALGILEDKPAAAGRHGSVVRHGISKGVLAGTVDEFDLLATDANGKLVVAYGADRVVAVALEAGVASDIIAVDVVAVSGSFAQHAPHSKSFSIQLEKISAADVITAFTPGYPGRIKKAYSVCTEVVATAAKAATLNLEIGTTDLTGGVLALTSANQTPLGVVIAATAVTAANTFGATDTISVEATGVTAFVEGEIELVIEFA